MFSSRLKVLLLQGLLWLISRGREIEAFVVSPAVLCSDAISGGTKTLTHTTFLNALRWSNDDPSKVTINSLREIIKEKDARIQEKDARIQEKDAVLQTRLQEKDAVLQARLQDKDAILQAKDAILQAKDAILQEKEDALVSARGEISVLKAAFNAEANLRPLLEMRVRDWYNDSISPGKTAKKQKPSMTERFKKFVNLQDTGPPELAAHRQKLENCLDEAVKLGQLEPNNEKLVRGEMQKIYDTLSYLVHDTKKPPGGVSGFVVNRDVCFAAAASAIMMYFGDSHLVFSPGYEKLRYKWPVQEEEEEIDDE